MQYLEKYTKKEQQLAYIGWRWVNREEELVTGGEAVGNGRDEGSSAAGDWGQAAVSLSPDVDGTGSGPFLEPDACSHLWNFTTEGSCAGDLLDM